MMEKRYTKANLPKKILCGLQQTFCLAQEVGTRLGKCQNLFGTLQK